MKIHFGFYKIETEIKFLKNRFVIYFSQEKKTEKENFVKFNANKIFFFCL